jgi:hypothetical protein
MPPPQPMSKTVLLLKGGEGDDTGDDDRDDDDDDEVDDGVQMCWEMNKARVAPSA